MLSSNRRLLAGCMITILAGIATAGCHDGAGRPAGLPAVSSVSSVPPTGSAGTTAPLSSRRRPRSPRAAATAAVRHYYRVFNQLHHTMDAGALADLFTSACPCRAQVRAVRTAAGHDEHYVDRVSVNVMRPSVQDRRHAFVLVNLDTARGGLVRADGRVVTTAPPRRGVQRVFRLVRTRGHWLIARIDAA